MVSKKKARELITKADRLSKKTNINSDLRFFDNYIWLVNALEDGAPISVISEAYSNLKKAIERYNKKSKRKKSSREQFNNSIFKN